MPLTPGMSAQCRLVAREHDLLEGAGDTRAMQREFGREDFPARTRPLPAGDARARQRVFRQRMRLLVGEHLQPVLESPQE